MKIVFRALVFLVILSSCNNKTKSTLDSQSTEKDTTQVVFDVQKLPRGSEPNPIAVPYFPSRLHAVVWRNWELVTVDRIALTVGATPKQIRKIASSMGLPSSLSPSTDDHRAYITILRRNWHYLPYEQLMILTNMTARELFFSLREDDFLFIKFGKIKPHCEVVRYAPPSKEQQRMAARIAGIVRLHFGDKLAMKGESRFDFVRSLQDLPINVSPPEQVVWPVEHPRYIYSYFGMYGDPLANPSMDPFPEGLLAHLVAVGVNGVWLHVVLRNLAPGGEDFPEFGEGWQQRLETLRQLVTRAKRWGIEIYLYLNEPRAQPLAFFKNRQNMKGVVEDDFATLCTSNSHVRKWLSQSIEHVFREVPDLGGIFTITASENLTNCASHFKKNDCLRCRERSDAEIITDVNAALAEGVHRAAPKAKIIAWDWGWHRHGIATDFIQILPKDIWLMSVSEWAVPIERGGVSGIVGEYSISAVGPGPRATAHWKAAQKAGIKTMVKLQLNNSWELSAVPWLPVLDLVAEHMSALAKRRIDGSMLSWTLGGYPSPNLQVAEYFAKHKDAIIE